MECKIVKLSTNRFRINGIIYKRYKSAASCVGCHFYCAGRCLIGTGIYCIEETNGLKQFYHLIPNEL